ncbi:MAG: EAL domain-containing protein [Clostridia bacterium]|nr:EAL domain-containing protein [Clostridia bacterium]
MAERYQYTEQELRTIEGLQIPFAVYQFINKRVVTLALSDGFCRLLGYEDRAQAVYDMDHDMYRDTHPDDVNRIANAAVRFATEGGTYDVVYRSKVPNGAGYRMIHARGEHVMTPNGTRLAHVWYFDEGAYDEGVDQAGGPGMALNEALNNALHEESILKANRYDMLTGLPNLNYFFELAEAGKAAIVSGGDTAVMLYMDLNGMKYFNHRNGFAEGDRLLKSIARILKKTFSNENCCHISADRFAVFTKAAGLEDVLQRFFEEVSGIDEVKTLPVRVGIYVAGVENLPAGYAFDRAKIACDSVLKSDISGFRYYDEELQDDLKRRQYILTHIDEAIENGWIRVYYQPIVRAMNERVCDEEALARWIDPAEGFLSPAEFIPYLEQGGLIYKLDLYIVEQVLEKLRMQEEAGLFLVPQSVNLSRSDFDACDIVEEIRLRVDAAGVSRKLITIEITESMIGTDFDFMKEQVERFRALGFPVWMDDFGSGYSSLDVLQSLRFDLIKFDMSFMRKLDEGENGKIILTELMKMATSLGVDTVCEGVETENQVHFLQEIGCSKLQGYYYCKPIPLETILERYRTGKQIGFENPDASAYYEAVGRVNLYDLGVIASGDEDSLEHAFNTLPMGIIEIRDNTARFVRSNPSYREFIRQAFGIDMSAAFNKEFIKFNTPFMRNIVQACSEQGARTFFDDKLPNGSVVHTFARRISANPVTGSVAVVAAVLSVSQPDGNMTYAEIARALATDYYNIYVVDLDTEEYTEFSSPMGKDELAVERRGTDFFASAKRDTMTRIYTADRELFLEWFNKENIIRELDAHGVFTSTYRLIDSGEPIYVNMKIIRMQGGNRIIIGVSIIDSQMKQREAIQHIRKERDALARVMAIAEDYISIYSVDPKSGEYVEYNSSEEYKSLGLTREGRDFFEDGLESGKTVIHPDDQRMYMARFNRDVIMREIWRDGVFRMHYRLMFRGGPKDVTLKIVSISDGENERLLAGVRAWKERQ